jgi:hypothetical protein
LKTKKKGGKEEEGRKKRIKRGKKKKKKLKEKKKKVRRWQWQRSMELCGTIAMNSKFTQPSPQLARFNNLGDSQSF